MYRYMYKHLENNPKQIRTLIGLKPCFYNSVETQNYRELLTQWWHEQIKIIYILMIEVKVVIFLFCVAVFSKRNKHVVHVSIEL